MSTDERPRYRRRRLRGSPRGTGRESAPRGRGAGATTSLGSRTTARALVAVGTYVAQDLRDPEGLTRPLLRRAALRLSASPSRSARRLADTYLRLDPPDASELRQPPDVIEILGPDPSARTLPSGDDHADSAPAGYERVRGDDEPPR